MPYIKKAERERIDKLVDRLFVQTVSEGQVNYAITRLIQLWAENRGVCYATLNAAVGILTSAKDEFVRKVVAPYEDKKIAENGPVGVLDGVAAGTYTGLHCAVCGEPQRMTHQGPVCENGHGGAPSREGG